MAGIQVPKINRFEPQGPAPAGQNTVNIPDATSATGIQSKALTDVAAQQLKYFQAQEDAVIDTASKAAANEYNIYLNSELNKAKVQQGDPTHAYSQFNENLNLKYEEILNKNPNMTARGKQAIINQLSDVATSYKMKSNTAYSGQYYEYDRRVTDDAVKITSQDLMTASSYIDPKDESSFKSIDSIIGRIGNLYKTHGEKFGAVTRDENGNQVATNTINLEIAKATSDGLVSAINNLNASNRPDLAEALHAKYYNYIDAAKQDNVTKAIGDKKRTQEAFQAVAETSRMTSGQIENYLNKKFADDPETKAKAYEAIDSQSRHKQNLQNRSEEQNFKAASQTVFNRMNSTNKFNAVIDMENDPMIAPLLPNMTVKQKTALINMVIQPKESNKDTLIKFYETFQNGDLKGMEPDKFFASISGLNKTDATRARKLYEKFNSPQTTAEERSMMTNMGTQLTKQLQAVGYIKSIDGKYNNKDKKKITDANNELVDQMDKFSNLPYAEQVKYVQKFAADKKKSETFKDDSGGGFFGGFFAPKRQQNTLENVETLDDQVSKKSAIRLYIQKNKKSPSAQELEAFRKKEKL